MKKIIPILLVAGLVYFITTKKKPIKVIDPFPEGGTPSGGSSLSGHRFRYLPLHMNG